MKYNVVIEGIGQSFYFSSLTREQKVKILVYCQEQDVSLNEAVFNDLHEILGEDWYDICEHESVSGVLPEQSYLRVYDEFDKIIFDKCISDIKGTNNFEDSQNDMEFKNSEIMFCLNRDKGIFLDELIDFEEKFNPTKLKCVLENLIMSDGKTYEVCVGFEYDNVFVDINGVDTKYHSFDVKFL